MRNGKASLIAAAVFAAFAAAGLFIATHPGGRPQAPDRSAATGLAPTDSGPDGARQEDAQSESAALAAAEARMPPQMTFAPAFGPCAHCHEVGDGARTSSGPVLNGVLGRKAGTRNDYPYSTAMKDSGIVWTVDALRRYLESPGTMVPGTRMRVGGFTDDEIAAVIAFLKTTPGS